MIRTALLILVIASMAAFIGWQIGASSSDGDYLKREIDRREAVIDSLQLSLDKTTARIKARDDSLSVLSNRAKTLEEDRQRLIRRSRILRKNLNETIRPQPLDVADTTLARLALRTWRERAGS